MFANFVLVPRRVVNVQVSQVSCDGIQGNKSIFLPQKFAEVAIFLLGDASEIIAGDVINCDGGTSVKSIWK